MMFQIDDDLLEQMGVSALQGKDREEFKDFLRTTLQERVGDRLTDGMSDEKLDEFGYFMDGDVEAMKGWLNANVPNYQNEESYLTFKNSNPDVDEQDILSSYGSLMWLQINCPDYPQIVKQTMEEIKKDVLANRQAIIDGLEG